MTPLSYRDLCYVLWGALSAQRPPNLAAIEEIVRPMLFPGSPARPPASAPVEDASWVLRVTKRGEHHVWVQVSSVGQGRPRHIHGELTLDHQRWSQFAAAFPGADVADESETSA